MWVCVLGMIYAKSSLDRETQSYYWLTVYAHDSGAVPRSSFVDVLIEVDDVNDNRPQTARPLYRPAVPEASPVGTPVIRLDAFDHDDTANGALSYRISSGNPQAFFTIDPLTGILSVLSLCTHTHTQPFNGTLSGTTRVSRYQKGKTNLDFTEARDSEWQWHQLGSMQICTSLQTDNHASTPPLSFLQARCPSCRPTNSVKALKALSAPCSINKADTILMVTR